MMMKAHQFIADSEGDCMVCPLPREHPRHEPAEALATSTPYAGTSGWSGSQASRERAETADRAGVTSERQKRVLALLEHAGMVGMTWREIAVAEVWHHGQASGALSALHKDGRIARLADERREKCSVYVGLTYVGDRATRTQGRAAADPDVVQREEWRVLRGDEVVLLTADPSAISTLTFEPGDALQKRTVSETPWDAA